MKHHKPKRGQAEQLEETESRPAKTSKFSGVFPSNDRGLLPSGAHSDPEHAVNECLQNFSFIIVGKWQEKEVVH